MTGWGRTNTVVLSLILGVLTGCHQIPVVVEDAPKLQPARIDHPEQLAPIQFSRLGINLRRGAVIGSYIKNFVICSSRTPDNISWNGGRVKSRSIEFTDLFYDGMAAANFNVVGDPKNLFGDVARETIKPEYLVGGQLEDIRMNVCEHMAFPTSRKTGTQSGDASVRVSWQVFSVFDKKVVYETETRGSIKMDQPVADGEVVLVTEAFSEAVANLAADQKLVEVLRRKPRAVADVRAVDEAELVIPYRPLFEDPITRNIDLIRHAVVTIDDGNGHGSGFFISPTLILTNRHVVGNADLLRIKLITGRRILGEVIRRHPERDVALIQVEAAGHQPLPVRFDPLKITEEVYAIGTPLYKSASGTVTKGIVSRFRTNEYGLEDIQADVDIHGGNSGGALLDGNGNVVGVTYAGLGMDETQRSVGMNLIIPIYDALDKLNVSVDRKRGRVVTE